MNREIKFRAWDSNNCIMMPYVNILGIDEGFAYSRNRSWIHNSMEWGEEDEIEFIENPILMQYTGLKDMNGKEIYEGDICTNGLATFTISFENYMWWGQRTRGKSSQPLMELSFLMPKIYEIIGNIYENQELLK